MIVVPAPMTKAPSPAGDPVELGALSFPELTRAREAVLDALGRPELLLAPTTRARDLYGGMLMDAALDGLTAEGVRRADQDLVYVSGLWGAVRPTDELPDYRVHMCERPEGIGHLVQFWQEPLAAVLPAADGLIVDFRSSDYLTAWRPAIADRWVVLKPVKDSTFAKGSGGSTARIARGRVLHRILADGIDAAEPESFAAALEPHFIVQLRPPAHHRQPWELRFVQPG